MKNRIQYDQIGDVLKIIILAKKNWIYIIYCSLFFAFWTIAGGLGLIICIFYQGDKTLVSFIPIWLIGECGMLFIISWILYGKETIEISKESIIIKKQLFGLGPSNICPISSVSDIRVKGLIDISIVFTYQNKDIEFGAKLNLKEAREVVEKIHSYLTDIIH